MCLKFTFQITPRFSHSVSRSDYIHERTRLEIPACADRVCHNITTVDDNTVEKLEYFFVNLGLDSRSLDLADNINITQSQKRYEIIDKDSKLVV